MGLLSRRKGKRGEREIVAVARAVGLAASREWHRAQSSDSAERVRDVRIGPDYYQVQIAGDGFRRIYAELQGVRGFFFRSDRQEWLIALRAGDYFRMLKRGNE